MKVLAYMSKLLVLNKRNFEYTWELEIQFYVIDFFMPMSFQYKTKIACEFALCSLLQPNLTSNNQSIMNVLSLTRLQCFEMQQLDSDSNHMRCYYLRENFLHILT